MMPSAWSGLPGYLKALRIRSEGAHAWKEKWWVVEGGLILRSYLVWVSAEIT
jgi:hypothetical protein